MANLVADHQNWLSNQRIAEIEDVLVANWQDIEDSLVNKEPEGIVTRVFSSNIYLFELQGFGDVVFKADKSFDEPFVIKRVADTKTAVEVVQRRGFNCLWVPRIAALHIVDSSGKDIYLVVTEKADIKPNYESIEEEYENYYALFADPAYADAWVGSFEELFRQLFGFSCETGLSDLKFDNIPLTKKGSQIALIDLEFQTPAKPGLPLWQRVSYAAYFLFTGKITVDPSFHVAVPHQIFFDDIYDWADQCLKTMGHSLPVDIEWRGNITIDKDLVDEAADIRFNRQTALREFKGYLTQKGIKITTPINLAFVDSIPVSDPDKVLLKDFLRVFNEQTAKRWTWTDYPLYTPRTVEVTFKNSDCQTIALKFDKAEDAGLIFDTICYDEKPNSIYIRG